MSAPRQPKAKKPLSEDKLIEEQRELLDRLHGKFTKLLLGGRTPEMLLKQLMAVTEVRGGFEANQARRIALAQGRAKALGKTLDRASADHAQLHVLNNEEPCTSLSACVQTHSQGPVGRSAAAVLDIGLRLASAEFQANIERLRASNDLGPPGLDSFGGVVAFLVDKGRPARLSFREVALLRLEARGRRLPFSTQSIETETEAVKKAHAAHGRPPRHRGATSAREASSTDSKAASPPRRRR